MQVRRAREGDVESQAWLIRRFSPLLIANARYRMWRNLRDYYDPEDIVNDVWLVALRKLPELTPREGRCTPVLLRFLSTTLVNRINELVRKHLRGKPHKVAAIEKSGGGTDAADRLPDETRGLLSRIIQEEEKDAVTEAIEALPDRDRELVVLRGIEQLPYRHISQTLGGEENALAVAYHRAIMKLRRALAGSVFNEFTTK
jgi:RNA polymerase sigma-70 factor (ECF subfamily)